MAIRHPDLGSFPLTILPSQFQFDGKLSIHPNSSKVIATKFCSCAVVSCAKFVAIRESGMKLHSKHFSSNVNCDGKKSLVDRLPARTRVMTCPC